MLRSSLQNQTAAQVVAVNDTKTTDYLAYLFKYDSVHGVYPGTVEYTDNALVIDGQTIPVTATELTVRITASGTVEPIRTVNLSPKSSGTVQELFVEQGDRVTQGQVIARMDSDQLNAQMVQNEASVAEARAQPLPRLDALARRDVFAFAEEQMLEQMRIAALVIAFV